MYLAVDERDVGKRGGENTEKRQESPIRLNNIRTLQKCRKR